MNGRNTGDSRAAALDQQTLSPTANERLAQSRANLLGWMVQDHADRAAAPALGWETFAAAWPVFKRWRTHPLAVLVMSTAARAWEKPAPGGGVPPMQVWVLGTAVALLRRHPKTVLVTIALAATLVVGIRWSKSATSTVQKTEA